MGTDIHMAIEYRPDSAWLRWGELVANPLHEFDATESELVYKNVYEERDRRVFSVLGLVNGVTANPVHPLRGLPDDCSESIRHELNADYHSHSHLTLAELRAYDWTQPVCFTARVSALDYAQWKHSSSPLPLVLSSGLASDDLTEEELVAFAARINTAELNPQDDIRISEHMQHTREYPHGRVAISLPAATACAGFLEAVMPTLKNLAADVGDENVRLVFAFDS